MYAFDWLKSIRSWVHRGTRRVASGSRVRDRPNPKGQSAWHAVEVLEPRVVLTWTPQESIPIVDANLFTAPNAADGRIWDDGATLTDRHSVAALMDLPGLQLVDPNVNYFDGQVIYLDFDGGRGVSYNGPIKVAGIDVLAFRAPGALAGQEPVIITAVLQALSETFAATGVTFTTEVPEVGTDYSTIYVGGSDSAFARYGSFQGLAEKVDVGNVDRRDSAFVFSETIASASCSAEVVARTLTDLVTHEAGHLLGFEHSDESSASTNPLDALAFKPYTHVEIGKDVLADLLPDGKVTIAGHDYTVSPAVFNALHDYPEFYNAGMVGPDGFPDILMGQGVIHPTDTGLWLSHLLDKAWSAQTDNSYSPAEKGQILAWSYGFVTHAASDMWAHTMVNEFADGVFPGFLDVVTQQHDTENAVRHLLVEGYIADATPGFDGNREDRTRLPDLDVSDDSTPHIPFDAPHRFIYETFIQPNAGEPTEDRGLLINTFLALRAKLVSYAGDPATSEADLMSQNSAFETLINNPMPTSHDVLETARNLVLRSYLREWIKDIDSGLQHWSELGLAMTRGLFDPQARRDLQNAKFSSIYPGDSLDANSLRAKAEHGVSTIDVVLHEAEPFITHHLLSMLGAPDVVGAIAHKLGQFSDFIRDEFLGPLHVVINPLLETIDEIKTAIKDMIKDMVKERYGVDVEELNSLLASPSSKLGLKSVGTLDLFTSHDRQKLDDYLGIPSNTSHKPLTNVDFIPDFVAAFHPGAVGGFLDATVDQVTFNKTTFAAYANSVTMSKLVLLDGVTLGSVFQDLLGRPYDTTELNPNAPQHGNIMTMTLPNVVGNQGTEVNSTEWLRLIDTDHVWRQDSQLTTQRIAAAGSGTATANWTFTGLDVGGSYTVWSTWQPTAANGMAPYKLFDGVTLKNTVTVNQSQAPK